MRLFLGRRLLPGMLQTYGYPNILRTFSSVRNLKRQQFQKIGHSIAAYQKTKDFEELARARSMLFKLREGLSIDLTSLENQLIEMDLINNQIKLHEEEILKEINMGYDHTMEKRYALGIFIAGLCGAVSIAFHGIFSLGIFIGYYYCNRMIKSRETRDAGLVIVEEHRQKIKELKSKSFQLTKMMLCDLQKSSIDYDTIT